ncbi:hypothetical protein VTJ83DRAFT_4337 [Remersonia thermophila]|uniref:Transcription factor CBF/NF-Y/archaeal histone domain-containing protein n=1 Tax=Remersonia thermophila TaxID=72144 RepID=A0ABR4DAF0_9PEZI
MPYNTTAIPPRKEVTGQTQLPLTRVKKIIAMDPDITVCSNNAAFAITLATEMFVQYLAEEAQKMTKLDRKPRRNIQYKDMANAIAHRDNLEFLEDVVPRTVPYKEVKAKAAAARAKMSGEKVPGDAGADDRPAEGAPSGKRAKSAVNGSGAATSNGSSRGKGQQPSGAAGRQHDGDVDMTG